MVYFEIKSMIIKKLGLIYVWVCLCGKYDKLEKQIKKIKIKEDDEILREKYVSILDDLLKLQRDGKLVLNQVNIEKVNFYLQTNKVLNAAGIDPNYVPAKGLAKITAQNQKKYSKHSKVHPQLNVKLFHIPCEQLESTNKSVRNDNRELEIDELNQDRIQLNLSTLQKILIKTFKNMIRLKQSSRVNKLMSFIKLLK